MEASTRKPSAPEWLLDLLLVVVLLAGAFLRFSGIYWGEWTYMHPDERFLVWVGTDISPLQTGSDPEARQWLTLNEYFDTPNSPLNPNNRGHGFYVYGTLPMFLTRYAVELIYGHSGFQEMTEVGRPLSALSDLLVVFLVYLVAKRLYNRKVGLLAAAFSAAAVLQIQQAHFFTMDTFLNFFMMLAVYFAVVIMTSDWDRDETRIPEEGWSSEGGAEVFPYPEYPPRVPRFSINQILRHPLFLPALGFGLALGMAMASKVSSILIPLLLPAAMLIRMAQMSERERRRHLLPALGFLALAAVVSVIVFRIFQPYAFSGPGFFGVRLNEVWLENLRTQRAQATPDADFPPAMQWARRPVWFSAQNLILWGLGLPLGVLAFFGVGWAGWQMLKGKWQRHALLWGWTIVYFVWQSLQINPTMRYQLPIYPMLTIFAGWAVMELFQAARRDAERRSAERLKVRRASVLRLLGALVGVGVLAATFIYAFAFVNGVYGQTFTRAASSYWVYQNIPGPINLPIQTGEGTYNQPVPFPYSFTITPGVPYLTTLRPNASGGLSEIVLHHVLDVQPGDEERTLRVTLSSQTEGTETLGTAELQGNFPVQPQFQSAGYRLSFDQPVMLDQEQTYSLRLEMLGDVTQPDVVGNGQLRVLGTGGELFEQGFESPVYLPASGQPFFATFVAQSTGLLTQIRLSEVTLTSAALLDDGSPPAFDSLPPGHISVSLAVPGEELEYLGATLTAQGSGAGEYLLSLDEPIPVNQGETYALSMAQQTTSGALSLMGAGIANEGDWDDGLPLRVENYDGFGGIYPLDLNFNMYWDDNPDKLARFTRILDQSEYVLISSSRQWGSLPRIPERFPMTTIYYRNLLGCPVTREIEWCYNVAEPGMFQGNLGYDLVEVFANPPQIGGFEINDQFAEEAFTVYDHPKVFVFQKRPDYSAERVASLLGAVDFSKVIRIPPMRAGSQPANLMLPEERWAQQQAGGTWSALFNTEGLLNRFPAVGAVVWYLSVFLLGLVAYPALRLAFPGLPDHGYPLARTAGLLILSYLSWLAGSVAPGLLPFTRTTIAVMAGLMVLGAVLLGFRQRAELSAEWRSRRRYFLIVEGLFLAFFVFDLLIRVGNPDLWHPWKGGEKPMDFSYFNAVLKSTSFPPYDPWYAGGYLNYYYYGFVFVGTPVKLLGIVPAIAYNLILPTLFAMIALGAFSIAFNLYTSVRGAILPLTGGEGVDMQAEPREEILPPGVPDPEPAVRAQARPPQIPPYAYWVGLAGALGMALLGNLGSVRMIFQGYQRLAAPGGVLEGAGLFQRWAWALEGFIKVLGGETLPYALGDWYWIPSRAIPAMGDVEPITEFPFFTVLYADPHAHLFALPIALLALGFVLAVVLGNGRWRSLLGGALAFLLGGMAIGALRPTNTWDFPTYLALGVLALVYSQLTNFCLPRRFARRMPFLDEIPRFSQRFLAAMAAAGLLVILAFVLYQPYAEWYGLGYTKIDAWKGTHTPMDAYLTHWGLFLFVIVAWMFWETHQWMAETPLSALRRLRPYKGLIQGALLLLVAAVAGLILLKVRIAWFALPLAAWAGVLLLKPHQPNAKRFILFLVGTGLVLTLMVELIVLRGDIGRMNTVFKFYLQVWTLFAVSAAAGLGWLLVALPGWLSNWRVAFRAVLTVLVAGAALYPLLAGTAKVKDRMYDNAPHTLDGLAFMERAVYGDEWGAMDLGQDYQAIRWMQENISGSPVIVEANLRNLYRWGSRFSIYTGLPGVVGWEWHQQQQRALVPADWVSSRIAEVDQFYLGSDLAQAMTFLRKYDVEYIVVGQQERGHYPGPGLDKFEAQNGLLWNEVYREGDTVIYQVNGDI